MCALVACGGGGGGEPDPSTVIPTATRYTILVGGVTRTYNLYVPPNFRPNSSALVMIFHGSGDTAEHMEVFSQMTVKAKQEGFAVVYPQAAIVAEPFTTGGPPSFVPDWMIYFATTYYLPPYPDDIGYLRALINYLQGTLHPDPKRIYAAGMSSGSRMAQRVGVELSDLVAAVGGMDGTLWVVPATLGIPTPPLPNVIAPVSVVILRGQFSDPSGRGYLLCDDPNDATADDAFAYWTGPQANSCATISTADQFCSGATRAITKTATACSNGTEVRQYVLLGGVHQWYFTPMTNPAAIPYNPDLNNTTGTTTNDILWNFFLTHPKP